MFERCRVRWLAGVMTIKSQTPAAALGYEVPWSVTGTLDDDTLRLIADEVETFLATWHPRYPAPAMNWEDYRHLGYAWHCFDLARGAQDGPVSDLFAYLDELREALYQVLFHDPRYIYHYCLADCAAVLAGEFNTSDAVDALKDLAAVMPEPIEAHVPGTEIYFMFYDEQPDEEFLATRRPRKEHIRLDACPGDQLPEFYFRRPRQIIYPDKPLGDHFPSAILERECVDGSVAVNLFFDEKESVVPHWAAAELRRRVDAILAREDQLIEVTEVEYYLESAAAHITAVDLVTRRHEDTGRMLQPLTKLERSIERIITRNPYVAPAKRLVKLARKAVLHDDPAKAIDTIRTLLQWLPTDYRMWLPGESDDDIAVDLIAELNSQGVDLARVTLHHTSGEYEPYMEVWPEDEEVDVPPPDCFLFAPPPLDEDLLI